MLAELTDEVYSVEIVPELAGIARAVLDALGYEDEVTIRRGDGYFGWEEHAPFDAIIVTAAPDHLPRPLVSQLDPDGGRMVIPIGPVGNVQTLWLVTRDGDDVEMERLLDVRFVPFTRETSGIAAAKCWTSSIQEPGRALRHTRRADQEQDEHRDGEHQLVFFDLFFLT